MSDDTAQGMSEELVTAVVHELRQTQLWGGWEQEQHEEMARAILAAVLPLTGRGELVAEVERLRSEIARGNQEVETLNHELEVEREQQREANDAADELRARLDEIGETREEWSLVWPDGDRDDYGTGEIPARVAQEGTRARLDHRLAGKWREVEQEAEPRLQCGCLGYCEGGPECLDDGGGPWPQEREASE